MLKNVLLVLCISILFFGCIKLKSNAENSIVNDITGIEKENKKYSDNEMFENELLNHPRYNGYFKSFTIWYKPNLIDLEKFPQNILSKHIEWLNIDCDLTDIQFLEKFLHLRTLKLQIGKEIDNIEILRNLTNLEHLTINKLNGNIDLSPISNLKNLKYLLFNYSEINDLSSISCLENLEYIYFYNSEIENTDPIYDLINLKNLTFDYKENYDLTYIGKLQNLEYLKIPFLTQRNLNFLIDLKQLRELDIYKFIGNDINPLLKLSNLEELRINYNRSINYAILVNINSLKEILFSWDSYDDWRDFADNKKIFFRENGISTPLDAKQWE